MPWILIYFGSGFNVLIHFSNRTMFAVKSQFLLLLEILLLECSSSLRLPLRISRDYSEMRPSWLTSSPKEISFRMMPVDLIFKCQRDFLRSLCECGHHPYVPLIESLCFVVKKIGRIDGQPQVIYCTIFSDWNPISNLIRLLWYSRF